ncbi:ParE family toxin-like protein, partial [Clostridium perfringens]
RAGRLFPKKSYGKKYLTLRVNKRWRLLSKDDGHNWLLLTHNDYNCALDK